MSELIIIEKILFYCVLLAFAFGSAAAVRQLSKPGTGKRLFVTAMIALGVLLEAVILFIRGMELRAVPLTGLFESMLALGVVLGGTFLIFRVMIRQDWFSAVMAWVILAISLITAVAAKPAGQVVEIAKTPWIILHSVSMVTAGAMIAFSAAAAGLFLICRGKLKHKNIAGIVGTMPDIEKLQRLNIGSLKICFAMMTLGILSGIGVAYFQADTIGIEIVDWLKDSKVVIMLAAWMFVAIVMGLSFLPQWKGRRFAQATIFVFALIMFALVGAAVFCNSMHDFSGEQPLTQLYSLLDGTGF